MVDKIDTSLLCIKLVLKMLWFLPIIPQEIPLQGEPRVAEQALQQIRQIVNSQSQDRAKKAQQKQVHSTSTVNCSETFTGNTNQVPGTSVLNSSHQFNVYVCKQGKTKAIAKH